MERLFDGMEDTLEEIYLSHNLLGDNLSPIFSSTGKGKVNDILACRDILIEDKFCLCKILV